MKKVIVYYNISIDCQQEVELPNDFEFKSFDPDEMLEELEGEIGSFEPKEIIVKGDDVNDVDFYFVYHIDLLDD